MDEVLGIPDRKNYGDADRLKARQRLSLFIQQHLADKAGKHYDIRIGNPELGLLSWATKKELPEPGERISLFQQPVHDYGYGSWEGEIPSGYGKGKVSLAQQGNVLITRVTPSSIQFSFSHEKYPRRFVLVRPKDPQAKNWLLINTTPAKELPYEKIHFKSIPPSQVDAVLANLQPGSSVQAKIDGAAALVPILDKNLDVMSYRTSKVTGRPISHTEKVFGERPQVSLPAKYNDVVLRGELFGMRDGKAIPVQELGGLLNSSLDKSLDKQQDTKTDLKTMLFDVQHLKGKALYKTLPHEERMAMLREIVKSLPGDKFLLPEEAKTPEAAKSMWTNIVEGNNPLTEEGVVIHPPGIGTPSKIKQVSDHDVYVTGLFKGEGKASDAGGLEYSLKPGGPVVGRIGSGFSDETRAMLRDMDEAGELSGRVAKIKAMSQLPSGAFRMPVFIGFHEDPV